MDPFCEGLELHLGPGGEGSLQSRRRVYAPQHVGTAGRAPVWTSAANIPPRDDVPFAQRNVTFLLTRGLVVILINIRLVQK